MSDTKSYRYCNITVKSNALGEKNYKDLIVQVHDHNKMKKTILIIGIILIIGGIIMFTKPTGQKFNEPFELGYQEKAVFEDGFSIKVTEIVHESIEGDPEDPQDHGGSGVTVDVTLKKSLFSKKTTLSLLPKQYNPQPTIVWKGYTITLIDANQKAMFKVEK